MLLLHFKVVISNEREKAPQDLSYIEFSASSIEIRLFPAPLLIKFQKAKIFPRKAPPVHKLL